MRAAEFDAMAAHGEKDLIRGERVSLRSGIIIEHCNNEREREHIYYKIVKIWISGNNKNNMIVKQKYSQ